MVSGFQTQLFVLPFPNTAQCSFNEGHKPRFQVLLSLQLLLLLVGKAARASQNFLLAKGAGIVIPFYLASWRWLGICHKISHSVEIADFFKTVFQRGLFWTSSKMLTCFWEALVNSHWQMGSKLERGWVEDGLLSSAERSRFWAS